MGIPEKTCAIFTYQGNVLVVELEYDGELIICIIPLGSFQSYFLRHLLSITLIHDIISLGPECGNHMHVTAQYSLHAGIMPRSYFGPGSEAIARDVAVDVQYAPTTIPFMGE